MSNRVIPAGTPPWTRSASIQSYGGSTEKQNFNDRAAIDALTDVDVAAFARMTADMPVITRTAPFTVMKFGALVTPDVGSPYRVVSYVATMTGVRNVPYRIGAEPPQGFPRVDRNGTGDYTVSLADTYTDAYGVTAPFAISHVGNPCAVHLAVCRSVAEIVDATTVRVRIFDEADAPLDPDGGATVEVY